MHVARKSYLGIGACACVALLLSLFLYDSADARLAAPAICLQMVIAASLYWGRLAGFIGSVIATLTFETLLFPPVGSFVVPDPTERAVLILFQLSAIGVVLLSPRRAVDARHRVPRLRR